MHEVRKRAKQARYAYEAIAPIAASPVRDVAQRLAELQDRLGAHQDAVVAAAWLGASVHDDSASVDTAFAAGRLAQHAEEQRRRVRARWPRDWRRAEKAHRAVR